MLTIHLVRILFRIFAVVVFFLLFLLPDVCLYYHLKMAYGDFSGGPVVKNLHCNAKDTGSIPGQGTRIPRLQLEKLVCHSEDPVQPKNRKKEI